MSYEEFAAQRVGSLVSSSDVGNVDVNVSCEQVSCDGLYEIYFNGMGERCIRLGAVASGNALFMPFVEWELLADTYGLTLNDENLVDRVKAIYDDLPLVDDVLFH